MSGQVEEIRLVGGGPELYARLRTSDHEAPTIVLLCGLGFHTFEYEPLAELLRASGYNVVSFDYRGHGRSHGPRGRWSLADLASDARRAVGLVSGRGFVIQGRTDRLQPAEQSQILFDAANDPSEHQLVDAGHLPHLENTGLITKRLVDWFDNTT